MNKKIVIVVITLISVLVLLYLVFSRDNKSSTDNKVSEINYKEENVDFSSYDEVSVNLNEINDVYTISKGGVYHFTGSFSNYIKIDTTSDVKIILDNVTIDNNNGPCIYGVNSKNIYIELVGENNLTDGSYDGFDEEVTSCIFSNDDLIFSGDGALNITSNYNDGISSDDDIVIESGTYKITSVDDGIRGKDSIIIKNGKFTINAGGDGIKSTNDTDSEKGYILIENGTFNITSTNDSIQASTNIEIDDGEFTIKSGSGYTLKVNDMWNRTTSSDTESQKGIKADNNILIKNGNITIDSSDDSIHSNNTIQIDGGTINISSSDDGIHADGLVVINNGTIDITASEGIEATYVKINDGTINISASDDGINAGNKSSDYEVTIEINGGNTTIKMGQGDTDGIDSNGNIYINGGTINITANSPFDYDKEAKYNGGTIIVNGETTNTITNQFGGMNGGNLGPMGGNMNRGGRR